MKYTLRHVINTYKCMSLNNELVGIDRTPNLFSYLCVRVRMCIPIISIEIAFFFVIVVQTKINYITVKGIQKYK